VSPVKSPLRCSSICAAGPPCRRAVGMLSSRVAALQPAAVRTLPHRPNVRRFAAGAHRATRGASVREDDIPSNSFAQTFVYAHVSRSGPWRRGPLNRSRQLAKFALPCTFLVVAHPSKRFWNALSTSPQAGCSIRSQSLWTLWATPSAMFVVRLSSRLNSATRRERPALPALRVAWVGLAPRPGRPLMHVQWGVAPRAPVQGR